MLIKSKFPSNVKTATLQRTSDANYAIDGEKRSSFREGKEV